ncbi:MAG TPA: hypothetical protein VGQ83_31040 [Polyangia bacterium]|jgi:hypothetical protein
MTDIAVDKDGHLYGVSASAVYPLQVNGTTVHCATRWPLPTGARFYGLTFAPATVLQGNATPKAQLTQQVTAALTNANHVSIYGTGYGPDGMHLVHRNYGHDGAIVIRPLSATPHFLLFRFADQSF